MVHTFDSCPNCGTTDPDDFTVTQNGEEVTAEEAFTFFKIPHEAHTVANLSCDLCEYETARSVTIN